MKRHCFFVFLMILLTLRTSTAQIADSSFIEPYRQKMWATGYISTSSLIVTHKSHTFMPNYPINAGVGLGIRNTVINLLIGHSIAPLKGSAYPKTKSVDFQIHHYGRRLLVDLYYQKYKGFYTEENQAIHLFPSLSAQQVGVETTYILNANKFSAKAAFEQSEKQILSAGSVLLGSGLFWQRLVPQAEQIIVDNQTFENIQIGLNAGYAYSWVADKHWLINGMINVGANFGNETKALRDYNVKIYPSALARASSTYYKNNWSVSFSMLISNKSTSSNYGSSFSLSSMNMRLAYVKQLNYILKKKR